MPSISWFEIPADDTNRAKEFYNKLFNWKFEKWNSGNQEMDFHNIETNTQNKQQEVYGGLMKRQDVEQKITVYFNVSSIDESSQKVKDLGGKIIVTKSPVPKMGYFAVCKDTENNAFGLWETNENAS